MMKAKGRKVFAATGRHLLAMVKLPLDGLCFDGYVHQLCGYASLFGNWKCNGKCGRTCEKACRLCDCMRR